MLDKKVASSCWLPSARPLPFGAVFVFPILDGLRTYLASHVPACSAPGLK